MPVYLSFVLCNIACVVCCACGADCCATAVRVGGRLCALCARVSRCAVVLFFFFVWSATTALMFLVT